VANRARARVGADRLELGKQVDRGTLSSGPGRLLIHSVISPPEEVIVIESSVNTEILDQGQGTRAAIQGDDEDGVADHDGGDAAKFGSCDRAGLNRHSHPSAKPKLTLT
jgi:hypothetical protein